MGDDLENDLFWHALNYRTASTEHADYLWRELQACVQRLIAAAVSASQEQAR